MQCVRNCSDPDPRKRHHFEQPVLQTAQMFVGEMGCWIVVGLMRLYSRYTSKATPAERGYEAVSTSAPPDDPAFGDGGGDDGGDVDDGKPEMRELKGRNILMLALPSVCDICGTTLMNVGLLLVAASIYQMTRGALVLFVGLFSVLFLRRKLHLFQWLSLLGVVMGVAVVGLSGVIWPDQKASSAAGAGDGGAEAEEERTSAVLALIGFLLIAGAQIFTATQFVLEEWILERFSIEPIKMVGWEGIFGFLVTVLGMTVLHFAVGRTESGRYGPFDMVEGWRQMTSYRSLATSSILIMISIG